VFPITAHNNAHRRFEKKLSLIKNGGKYNTRLPQTGRMRITQENYVNGKFEGEQDIRQAYRDYLHQTEWTHFATLTFRTPVSATTAWGRFNQWLSSISTRYLRTIPWFAVVEFGEEQERHIHALLKAPTISSDALRSQWKAGFSDIQAFDIERPGISYLTKTLNRDDAEYDLEIITDKREESISNETKARQRKRSRSRSAHNGRGGV
jgi:hypothetical protein